MSSFSPTCSYKLIYIFRINDDLHQGMLKIGDASLRTSKPIQELPPNCHDLNQAAKKRIATYTATAGIHYELLHTQSLEWVVDDTIETLDNWEKERKEIAI